MAKEWMLEKFNSIKWWALSLLVLTTTIAGTIGYVYWSTARDEDATCLAYVIDAKLDQFAVSKHRDNLDVAKRQVEAIARVHLAGVKRNQMTVCPQSWVRWSTWSRIRYFVGAKQTSPRWQLIYPVARRAVVGDYHFPWPSEWNCVDDVQPTNSPRNWGKWVSNTWHDVKVAGKIENMTLYCTGKAERGS